VANLQYLSCFRIISTIFEIISGLFRANGILSTQLVYINLEDGNFRHIRTSESLFQYVEERLCKTGTNYVFLDEVQQVTNFQEGIDWLYTKKNVDLYITGSNAFLLSGELATLLSGRYVEIKMQPLSFKEFISAYPNNTNLPELYIKYLQNSSFPGTLEFSRFKGYKNIFRRFV
jgi:uncharacterized protein